MEKQVSGLWARASTAALLTVVAIMVQGMGVAAEPAGSHSNKADQNAPNIILFLTDDLGWGDSKVYGHPYLKTPNIDRLAKGGTRFTNFYTAGSVCSPTRASFQTGRFPANLSLNHTFGRPEKNIQNKVPNFLDPYLPQVSSSLANRGFKTAHYGKWHLCTSHLKPPVFAPNPSHYGFLDFRLCYPNFSDVDPRHYFGDWRNAEKYPHHLEDEKYSRAYSTQYMVDETIRFMKEHKGEPVYVNLWTLVPHSTLYPTPEELAVYKDLEPKIEDFPVNMQRYLKTLKPGELKERMQIYCAAVTGLDQALGDFLDRLHEMGEAENTLVFFTSDNGPEDGGNIKGRARVGSPGVFKGRKRSIYEGGVRTSAIAYWPGTVPAGKVNTTSVIGSVDWYPTVCALSGMPFPLTGYTGEDISDILKGSSRKRSKPLFWEWKNNVRAPENLRPPTMAIRKDNWKLLMNADGTSVELYDIPNDPQEGQNLAKQETAVVKKLKAELLEWKASLPTKVPVSKYTAESNKGIYLYRDGVGTYLK